MDDLLPIVELYPEVALDAIRRHFPFPRNRKLELVAVRKALDRLVQGETGTPMSPQEAVTYLRGRVEAGAQSLAGREKRFTPHLTTFLNQRRYLASMPQEIPRNLEDAIGILSCYPNVTIKPWELNPHMPILQVISRQIDELRDTHGAAAASYIRVRVLRFAELYARWPDDERQFLPGPRKFFEEQRWNNDERTWVRTPKNGYQSERSRLHLIA